MSLDPDFDDDANDPVVRRPRNMVALDPEPAGVAGRVSRAVWGGSFVLGALLGGLGLGISLLGRQPAPPPGLVARAPRSPRPALDGAGDAEAFFASAQELLPAESLDAVERPLGRGKTLPMVLRAMGLDARLATQAVGALRPFVVMRALRPTDRVAVLRNPSTGALVRVEFRRAPLVVWAAHYDGTRFRGARVERSEQRRVRVAGFVVRGTLEASVQSAGLAPAAATHILEMLGAVDLPPALVEGDVLRVALEEIAISGEFQRYQRVVAFDYRGTLGARRGYWVAMERGGDWFDASGTTWERGPLRSPVPGARLSALFNPRRVHPTLGIAKPHYGMDYAAPEGTPVYAAADGIVASAGLAGASGNLVRIAHVELGVETGYAHLSEIAPGLRAGRRVAARERIGAVGTTGRSSGPHLHFSVRREGEWVDPLPLCASRRAVPLRERPAFETASRTLGGALDRVSTAGASARVLRSDAATTARPAGPVAAPGNAPEHEGDTSDEDLGDEDGPS
ncbi:MAG: M23 family metallopeptidase [Myxococcales bacterium]|nr:M23 family metallopeptidase [Myxococcales bacterium]